MNVLRAHRSAAVAITLVLLTGFAHAGVSVTPTSTCLGPGEQQQFKATVTFNTNTAVVWSVNGINGGNNTVGTITTGGLYTAPITAGTFTVKATSVGNTAQSATASARVQTSVTVSLNQYTAAVFAKGSTQFRSTVCGTANKSVTWYVDNILGGSATAGVVDSTGRYTAPSADGTHVVKAVSVKDPAKSSGARATAFTRVRVDFGSQTQTAGIVPSGIIGAQYAERLPGTVIPTYLTGGFTTTRTYANIPQVFASQTPDWTKLDPTIAKFQTYGIKPVLEVAFAPSWLLPSPPPCSSAPPTDINRWAQLVSTIVAHLDQKFPGVVQDYEIWNEPSFNLCGTTDKLGTYLKIYAAAGAAIRNQATLDNVKVRIGGPASFGETNWISALLTNTSTAPYVDFISYHRYLSGGPDINAGMNWDSSTATRPLYPRTQDPGSGEQGPFLKVQAAANGKPVYLDEYNVNWVFAKDCCRNDATFGPLWNALTVADLLNSVYAGASRPPAKLVYYAASAPQYFCLLGTIDANMDCVTSGGYTPYPQFYAYKLFGNASYLGMSTGAKMAVSVFPPTTQWGIVPTAFYNGSGLSLVIVNPLSVSFSAMPITVSNPGTVAGTATYYVLNAANPTITAQPLGVTTSGGTISATVNVPAYSTVAVRIR